MGGQQPQQQHNHTKCTYAHHSHTQPAPCTQHNHNTLRKHARSTPRKHNNTNRHTHTGQRNEAESTYVLPSRPASVACEQEHREPFQTHDHMGNNHNNTKCTYAHHSHTRPAPCTQHNPC